jgi:hypothetical protein
LRVEAEEARSLSSTLFSAFGILALGIAALVSPLSGRGIQAVSGQQSSVSALQRARHSRLTRWMRYAARV